VVHAIGDQEEDIVAARASLTATARTLGPVWFEYVKV
jgi:hypothetical protein